MLEVTDALPVEALLGQLVEQLDRQLVAPARGPSDDGEVGVVVDLDGDYTVEDLRVLLEAGAELEGGGDRQGDVDRHLDRQRRPGADAIALRHPVLIGRLDLGLGLAVPLVHLVHRIRLFFAPGGHPLDEATAQLHLGREPARRPEFRERQISHVAGFPALVGLGRVEPLPDRRLVLGRFAPGRQRLHSVARRVDPLREGFTAVIGRPFLRLSALAHRTYGSRSRAGAQLFFTASSAVSPTFFTELAIRLTPWPKSSARRAASVTALVTLRVSDLKPFFFGRLSFERLGIDTPSSFRRWPDLLARIAPATPATARRRPAAAASPSAGPGRPPRSRPGRRS